MAYAVLGSSPSLATGLLSDSSIGQSVRLLLTRNREVGGSIPPRRETFSFLKKSFYVKTVAFFN